MIPDKNLAELLVQRMHAGVPLPVPIALSILQQVCNGLEYAHSMRDPEGRPLGIVHGDVSPAHIYITEAGVVTLVGRATQHGTFAYMAPEYVMAGQIDARADLFALGVVAHEMLANQPLFAAGDDRETLDRVCQLPIPPTSAFNPQVAPDLDGVVFTALARDPAYRWQYAGMMRDAILGAAHRLGIEVAAPYHPMWADVLAGRIEAPLSRPPRGLYDPPPSGQFEAAPAMQFDVPVPRFTPIPPELSPPVPPARSLSPSPPLPALSPPPLRPAVPPPPGRFEAEATVEVSSLQVPAQTFAPTPPELEPEEEPATLSPGAPASAARPPEVWTDDDDGSTRIQPLDPAFLEAVSAAAAAAAAAKPKAPAASPGPAPTPMGSPGPSGSPSPVAKPMSAPITPAQRLSAPGAAAPIARPANAAPSAGAPSPLAPKPIPRIMGGPARKPGADSAPAGDDRTLAESPIARGPVGDTRTLAEAPAARSPLGDDRTLAESPVARGPLGNDRTHAESPGLVAPVARGPSAPSASSGAADGLAPIARGARAPAASIGAADGLAPGARGGDDRTLAEPPGLVAPVARGARAPAASIGAADGLAPGARGARSKDSGAGNALAPVVGRASTDHDLIAEDAIAPVGRASTANDELADDGLAPIGRAATVAEQEFEDVVDGEEDAPVDAVAPVGRTPRGNDEVAPVARGSRAPKGRPSAPGGPLADAPLAPELENNLAAELAAAGARASSARVQRPTASPLAPPLGPPPTTPELELAPVPAQAPVPQNQFDPELGPEPTQIGAMPLIAFGDVPLVSKIGENARRPQPLSLPGPSATFLPEQPEPPSDNKKKLVIIAGGAVLLLIIVIILIAR